MSYLIVVYNKLFCNCQAKAGDEYWSLYQLDEQRRGKGLEYNLQEMGPYGAEECEKENKKIVVNTPGMTVPEWCGSCNVVWKLLKILSAHGDVEYYLEVGLIEQVDTPSREAWYLWHASGFSEENPELN
jgi:hypothetical protein